MQFVLKQNAKCPRGMFLAIYFNDQPYKIERDWRYSRGQAKNQNEINKVESNVGSKSKEIQQKEKGTVLHVGK